ncbi:recombinase family protein [Alicyclobacillus dauci]|uniref:Recombinase family protein n=1 Tax=Alicyclobacillus dauci TaxID=1475485 RepID=A0ABY6Z5U8_9BACL|nr:recombinase family protein [Alicyclobacillus dauci]WAH38139.1 recombinase family protein [Alicyclobacillus dauci]
MSLRDAITDKKGVFYGRHSTDKQEMEMQRRVAKQVVAEYKGELLPVEYADPNVSATKVPLIKRTHLARLLDDAKEHKFDFVITYARDRLARDAYEHQVIREEMHELGIPIVLAATRSVYDSGDLVIELMQDGLSQYEVEQTRVRTRDTLVHRVEHGEWVGRKPPYGYMFDKDSRQILQVADEIIVVREIFDRYLKGEGCYRIAKALGGSWKKEKVKAIVTNPFYAGYLTAYKGKKKSHSSVSDRCDWVESQEPLKGIPAILTKEEWERCWNFFDQRRKGQVAPRHYNTNFLLRGLVACKDCGSLFQTQNQMTKSSTGKRYGKRYYFCKCRRFEAGEFETTIVRATLDVVNRRALVPGGVDALMEEVRVRLQTDMSQLNKDIRNLEKQVDEAKKRIEEADAEMRSRFQVRQSDETNEKMVSILQHYRLQKQADCNRWERQIKDFKTKLSFIEGIELKNLDWDDLYADALKGDRQALRRFLVFLIDTIIVNAAGEVDEFCAKVDLNH